MAYVIGLTGNIACGKSLVLEQLAELGAETIDADRVAHDLMAVGTPTWERIVEHFGRDILQVDGAIDRQRLGAIVFTDPGQLQRLEEIVHPPVVQAIHDRVRASRHRVVVVDAIKLFEAGLAEACDEVWVVTCAPETQLARLMRRNRYAEEEALRRITAQPPQAEKVQRADRVIDNGGTMEQTAAQVRAAWADLPV